MSSIREQRVSKDELYIRASDGREVTITRAQIVARFQVETGTRAQKRTKTLTWLRAAIIAALGVEQIDFTRVNVDFDDLDLNKALSFGRDARSG